MKTCRTCRYGVKRSPFFYRCDHPEVHAKKALITPEKPGGAAIDVVRPRFRRPQRWPFEVDPNALTKCAGFWEHKPMPTAKRPEWAR